MIRKSYNQAHAEWVAQMRAKNPEMAALWGCEDALIDKAIREEDADTLNAILDADAGRISTVRVSFDDALERATIKAFGVAPQDENERYAAAECLDARQCVKGRGED